MLPRALDSTIDCSRRCFMNWKAVAVASLFFSACTVRAEIEHCGAIPKGIPRLQDFIRHPLTQPSPPSIPSDADKNLLPATVSLRLTVNRDGKLTNVCVADNKPISHGKSRLIEAAAESVRKWTYSRDFGLQGDLRLRYAQGWGEVLFSFPSRSERPILHK
jgi:hypothetical protein